MSILKKGKNTRKPAWELNLSLFERNVTKISQKIRLHCDSSRLETFLFNGQRQE